MPQQVSLTGVDEQERERLAAQAAALANGPMDPNYLNAKAQLLVQQKGTEAAQADQAKQYRWADPSGVRDAASSKGIDPWTGQIQAQIGALGSQQQAPQMQAAQALGARLGAAPQMQATNMQAAQLGSAPQMQAAQLGAAPQMQGAQIEMNPQEQWRSQQVGLAQQLSAGASGNGPSAAQAQLKLATDRNMGQALALALGARGGNQAAAMKQAQMQRALISQEAGAQSAALRAQEQQAAQQQLGALSSQGRSQDIGLASQQAAFQQDASGQNLGAALQYGMQNAAMQQSANQANMGVQAQYGLQQGEFSQQAAAANQQAAMQAAAANQNMAGQFGLQQGAFDQQTSITNAGFQQQANQSNQAATMAQQQAVAQLTQQYIAMGMSAAQAQQKAQIDAERYVTDLFAQQEANRWNIGMQVGKQQADNVYKGIGIIASAASSGAGAGAMMSDERVKEDVQPGEAKLGELLSAVGAHDYRYKEPEKPLRGQGRFVSPMAQEIEATEIGRSMVKETPEGKMVDYGKGLGAMLSGLGWLHRRMEQLEQKLPLGGRLATGGA